MIDLRPAPFLLAGAIAIPLVLTLAVWGIDQYLDASDAKTKLLEEQIGAAQTTAERNLANINELIATLTTVRDGQAKLLMLQGELRTGLAQRERQIEDLKHEIKELQEWADRPLPGAARRLRERPAIIGADAYRKWLSGSGAVHPAGDSPDQQRPVAD
ncbi:phage lysis regulatory protein, LysB family [Pseudomonas sp. LAIL14HWK12:I11]|nr:phage lysis regulatory protein, LysB family [Pseudomonas sp. LAIL14HWK12:I11]SMR74276.1 phage lysis regulatory protein, LysB family [Pseudomonas sp. LAIL14HWK12:I10]SOD03555.1 phage lysis regulatory protein, LysB family [Pseudomonas sp. LAIL14HWK12:I8]